MTPKDFLFYPKLFVCSSECNLAGSLKGCKFTILFPSTEWIGVAQLVEWWEVMWEVMGSCVLCNVCGLYIYIYILWIYKQQHGCLLSSKVGRDDFHQNKLFRLCWSELTKIPWDFRKVESKKIKIKTAKVTIKLADLFWENK